MAKETFADRLKYVMEKKGKKQVDLIRLAEERGVKLGKSQVSQYVSGKTVPRADILRFLAENSPFAVEYPSHSVSCWRMS